MSGSLNAYTIGRISANPAVPCTLLHIGVDKSESTNAIMPGGSGKTILQCCNDAVQAVISSLLTDPRTFLRTSVLVSVFYFSDDRVEYVLEDKLLGDVDMDTLRFLMPTKGEGCTPMGQAIIGSLARADATRAELRRHGLEVNYPILTIITDGDNNDRWYMQQAVAMVDERLSAPTPQLTLIPIGLSVKPYEEFVWLRRLMEKSRTGEAGILRSGDEFSKYVSVVQETVRTSYRRSSMPHAVQRPVSLRSGQLTPTQTPGVLRQQPQPPLGKPVRRAEGFQAEPRTPMHTEAQPYQGMRPAAQTPPQPYQGFRSVQPHQGFQAPVQAASQPYQGFRSAQQTAWQPQSAVAANHRPLNIVSRAEFGHPL